MLQRIPWLCLFVGAVVPTTLQKMAPSQALKWCIWSSVHCLHWRHNARWWSCRCIVFRAVITAVLRRFYRPMVQRWSLTSSSPLSKPRLHWFSSRCVSMKRAALLRLCRTRLFFNHPTKQHDKQWPQQGAKTNHEPHGLTGSWTGGRAPFSQQFS